MRRLLPLVMVIAIVGLASPLLAQSGERDRDPRRKRWERLSQADQQRFRRLFRVLEDLEPQERKRLVQRLRSLSEPERRKLLRKIRRLRDAEPARRQQLRDRHRSLQRWVRSQPRNEQQRLRRLPRQEYHREVQRRTERTLEQMRDRLRRDPKLPQKIRRRYLKQLTPTERQSFNALPVERQREVLGKFVEQQIRRRVQGGGRPEGRRLGRPGDRRPDARPSDRRPGGADRGRIPRLMRFFRGLDDATWQEVQGAMRGRPLPESVKARIPESISRDWQSLAPAARERLLRRIEAERQKPARRRGNRSSPR